MKLSIATVLIAAALVVTLRCDAAELTVAAASDLSFALKDISANFQRETGNTIKVSFGSSGNLYTQILNGAPFDVFFSADTQYPQELSDSRLVEPGTMQVYAIGHLVLYLPKDSRLDSERKGLEALLDPTVKKIAIANPEHAPYGRAAVAALKRAGVYYKILAKLVYGENVSQAAQFVQSGNAQAGLVPLSLAMAPTLKDSGRYWTVPPDYYPALKQAVIIMQGSRNKKLALEFLQFLKKPESVEVLKRYGFTPLDEAAK